MNPLRNPLTWALACAILALSISFAWSIWRSPGRLKNIELGIHGLHAELNGHGTGEKLGEIAFEIRDIVRQHASLPVEQAHGRCGECPVEAVVP